MEPNLLFDCTSRINRKKRKSVCRDKSYATYKIQYPQLAMLPRCHLLAQHHHLCAGHLAPPNVDLFAILVERFPR
jgi:hypothetical protein